MKTKEKDPIERLADSSLWVDRLLELFWAVDEVFKIHEDEHDLHPEIRAAYLRAEAARREL